MKKYNLLAGILAFVLVAGFGTPVFGETVLYAVVGDKFLPIDTTALLLSGTQTNAVWIMSALAVIGSIAFGVLYITTRNPNNMRNIKVILRDYLDRS